MLHMLYRLWLLGQTHKLSAANAETGVWVVRDEVGPLDWKAISY